MSHLNEVRQKRIAYPEESSLELLSFCASAAQLSDVLE